MAFVALNSLLPKSAVPLSRRNSPPAAAILSPWEKFKKQYASGVSAEIRAWYAHGQKPPPGAESVARIVFSDGNTPTFSDGTRVIM